MKFEYCDIFIRNEESANRYVIFCMRIAAGVAVLMWLLNIMGFFIVDEMLMNIAMPVGIMLFLLPSLFVRRWNYRYGAMKYIIMVCFLLGIGVMSTALTIQLVLAWACPIILSCHYYSPRTTRFTLAGVLICMFFSVYIGLYYGVWDANMMRSNAELVGAGIRMEFIQEATAAGDNILLRVFNFYYIPRATILVVIYLIGLMLSKRTYSLLQRQEMDMRERERIGAELSVATQIQSDMLPCIFPAFPERPEFDIYASMTPAKEVGGDFYDFFLADDDHLVVVIADVSGKGIPAALFMVITKTLLKNAMQMGLSPKAALEKVNNQLCENNEAEMFATVWLGLYEISTGRLTAANAGHEYPAIRRGNGEFELLKDRHGFVLAGMEKTRYREYELQLEPGDVLFVYTDGVPEATDTDNALYGRERMISSLNSDRTREPEELLRALKKDIDLFVGEAPQFDDITMLAIQRKDVSGENMRKLQVTPALDNLAQICEFFEKKMVENGVPSKISAQINIAADEIFSNIVRYSGATSVTVGCEVNRDRREILLRFADNGRPYDPTGQQDPDITLSAEEREVGGLGIYMVKKSMDRMEYRYTDGFNVLSVRKNWR